MTPEQFELARRLVVHQEWKWVHGMQVLVIDPEGVAAEERIAREDRREPDVDAQRWPERLEVVELIERHTDGWTPLPDLADFATAAILLRLAIDECRLPDEVAGLLTPYRQEGRDLGVVVAEWLLLGWDE